MDVSYQLKDFVINWSHTAGTQSGPYDRHYGLAFVGNLATLVINREGWEIFPEKMAINLKRHLSHFNLERIRMRRT